jgi:hypothetical protein
MPLGSVLSAVPWRFPVRPSLANLADLELRRLVAVALLEPGFAHMPAPSVALTCATVAAYSIADLRGKAIRVILGAPPVPLTVVPPVNGIAVVTVWIPGGQTEAAAVPGVDCVAQDGAAAYAVLAGSADGHVIPVRILIDPEGVLRSVWREDDGDAWTDPGRLLEEVRTIHTEPLTIGTGAEHEHHD